MSAAAFEFRGHNGVRLAATLWLPDGAPRAILQMAHGMTEHIGRYEAFAQEMAARGIVVAGYDLRGHGRNPGTPDVASFGEGGWEASLWDMRLFFEHLASEFPGLPHHMLGFSLGSFLLREYLNRWPDGASSAIIMGTGNQPGIVLSLVRAIVRLEIKRSGFDDTTERVRQLSFGTYNRKFRPNRTASDWLCADDAQLDDYLADPLCRRDISSGLFWQLLGAMKRTGGRNACANWNRDMPVLLISGQDDPVGGMGAGVRAVKAQLDRAGLRRVSLRLLPGARHMLLNETASGAAQSAHEILADWMK